MYWPERMYVAASASPHCVAFGIIESSEDGLEEVSYDRFSRGIASLCFCLCSPCVLCHGRAGKCGRVVASVDQALAACSARRGVRHLRLPC